MSKLDIVRAWKDEEYCESLSDTQRASLPRNPVGVIELTDADLSLAGAGAEDAPLFFTLPFCPTYLCSVTACIPDGTLQ